MVDRCDSSGILKVNVLFEFVEVWFNMLWLVMVLGMVVIWMWKGLVMLVLVKVVMILLGMLRVEKLFL